MRCPGCYEAMWRVQDPLGDWYWWCALDGTKIHLSRMSELQMSLFDKPEKALRPEILILKKGR